MDYPSVILKPKEEGRLEGGHLWAFSNEVAVAPSDIAAGALADLFKSSKGFVGRGFYHPHSLIAFRILTDQKDQDIDQSFLKNVLPTRWNGARNCIRTITPTAGFLGNRTNCRD